jgi:hypothetical protein
MLCWIEELSTDASLRAEMLSYSRSRGRFAGVSLEGTSLRPDDDASAEIYGHKVTAREIVRGTSNAIPTPAVALSTCPRRKPLAQHVDCGAIAAASVVRVSEDVSSGDAGPSSGEAGAKPNRESLAGR